MACFYPSFFPNKMYKGFLFLAFLLAFQFITFGAFSKSVFFQNTGRIAGKVVDEKGEGIPGATVRVAGQTIGTQTGIDGSFSLAVKAGTYIIDISFISYQTKRITDVVVKSGEVTALNVSLQQQTAQLKEVVVSSTYRKSSTEGLYTRQKNASNITNGISAEQIAKTPDANVGQSLKRISGLATFDNKYVIVRGISERYNVATLDGTPLPSTDYTQRNFSFDLLPAEVIEGIVVHKTITPDLPVGFAGGMVQVNTRDIPTKNFVSFSIGTGFNDQSTGKDFISAKRGKYDYLGYDDGTRKMVPSFRVTDGATGAGADDPRGFTEADFQYARQFTNNWGLYKYKTQPNQNYTFGIGQNYNLKKDGERIGFIATLNYRNTQSIVDVVNQRSIFLFSPQAINNLFDGNPTGFGKIYNFNTTYGGVLNMGYRSKKHQISIRNSYSRIFSNPTTIISGYDNESGGVLLGAQYAPSTMRIVTEPDFLGLLQNKIQGEHQAGLYKLNWDVSRTALNRSRKDMLRRQIVNNNQLYGNYFHDFVDADAINVFPLSRQAFDVKETDYNWTASVSRPISTAPEFTGTVKLGYIGFNKKQVNNFITAYLRPASNNGFELDPNFVIEDVHTPENFAPNKLAYEVNPIGLNSYDGTSQFHAGYAMVDQTLWEKLRFVGGLRVEYFKLQLIGDAISSLNALISSPNIVLVANEDDIDKPWQILPSANLTYSVTDQFKVKAAYSQSMVRPEFNERSFATRYDPVLQGDVTGNLVISTKTDSYDLRGEWYPGLGEILSAGIFYKYLDRPLELTKRGGQDLYVYNNGFWAKSYGLELEVRKRLGFINSDLPLLDQVTVFSNATLLRSKVRGALPPRPELVDPANPNVYRLVSQPDERDRPLYGQTPFLLNTGVEYSGKIFGFNIVHNHSGRKFYLLTDNLALNEYEAPYDQVDVQLNANVLKNKGKIRFNFGNLFNNRNFYYNGMASYEPIDPNNAEAGNRLKPGYTDGYEKDDVITFSRKYGRTFTLSFNYTF
ncbi:TonB-dependent receptor domain-containing protein [Mucilaginibacter defluvii]